MRHLDLEGVYSTYSTYYIIVRIAAAIVLSDFFVILVFFISKLKYFQFILLSIYSAPTVPFLPGTIQYRVVKYMFALRVMYVFTLVHV